MPNWTKEFIAGQREIKPASVLPIVGKWDEVPAFEGALHYCAIFGFHKAETWSTGSDLAMQDIKYLENAANNYPSALDEIERAHTEIERLEVELSKRKKRKWHPASERPDQCPLRTTAQYAEAAAPRGQKEG